jgi:hypothetical protein
MQENMGCVCMILIWEIIYFKRLDYTSKGESIDDFKKS